MVNNTPFYKYICSSVLFMAYYLGETQQSTQAEGYSSGADLTYITEVETSVVLLGESQPAIDTILWSANPVAIYLLSGGNSLMYHCHIWKPFGRAVLPMALDGLGRFYS